MGVIQEAIPRSFESVVVRMPLNQTNIYIYTAHDAYAAYRIMEVQIANRVWDRETTPRYRTYIVEHKADDIFRTEIVM